MKRQIALRFLTLLFLCPPIRAQQTPSPQPSQAKSAPCGIPSTAPKAPSHFHFRIPPRMQQAINKEQAKIEAQTGISVDTAATVRDALAPEPCQASPVPTPQQSKTAR